MRVVSQKRSWCMLEDGKGIILSLTYVDVDFNKRAIDEDVHVQRLGSAVREGVGVEITDHSVVGELIDSRRVRAVDIDGEVGGIVVDVSVLLAARAGCDGDTGGSSSVAKSNGKLHVRATSTDKHTASPVADGVDGALLATKSIDNVGESASAECVASECTIAVLDNAGITLCCQTAVGVD